MRCVLLFAVILATASCGGSQDQEPGPASVHFSSDFPEVYGALEVEIRAGEDELGAVDAGSDSCESPTLVTDSRHATYRARTAAGFEWEGETDLSPDVCTEIRLTAGDAIPGFYVLFEQDPYPESFPIQIYIDEKWVGELTKPWAPNPWRDAETLDCAGLREYFLKGVREGRAFVVPLSEKRRSVIYHLADQSGGWAYGELHWSPGYCVLAVG